MGEVRDIDFFNALQAKPADAPKFAPSESVTPEASAPVLPIEENSNDEAPQPIQKNLPEPFEPSEPVADPSDFFSHPTPAIEEPTTEVTQDVVEEEPSEPDPVPSKSDPDRSGWTIPLLCAGIGIIACCMLIPAADDNRKLVYERERLKADLTQLKSQIDVNQEFLDRIVSDPILAERLAQRQMRMVREGTAVLQLKNENTQLTAMNPFEIVAVPPPAELPPYKPVAGKFAELCRNTRSQLFLLGLGLFLAATGLVLGGRAPTSENA